MSAILKAGELLWSPEGTHVWDEKGIALRCEQDTEVVFITPEIEEESLKFIYADREFRGLDPLTGETLPEVIEPEVIEPTPEVVEPVIEVVPEVVEVVTEVVPEVVTEVVEVTPEPIPEVVPVIEVVPIVDGIILEPTPEVVPEPTPSEGEATNV